MLKNNLGYPRIGSHRELKKACEAYWSGKIPQSELLETGQKIRLKNWELQKQMGVDLIPSNDFSFYDHVLDHNLMFGAIPPRYEVLNKLDSLDLYFAMARGYQKDGHDIKAMEMTKWFDTNYHYLVPEFTKYQTFKLNSTKVIAEFKEAKQHGIISKPVLIGPVSYLLLGKEKGNDFKKIDLLERLLPVYFELIQQLQAEGVDWIQFDEPFLGLDLDYASKEAYRTAYHAIRREFPTLKILLATYFEGLNDNALVAAHLPVCAIHLDLVRKPEQLAQILDKIPAKMTLSLGLIDGRNVWKTDFTKAISLIEKALQKIGTDRLMLAPSCSLIHSPCDLELENDEERLPNEVKNWMAFAKQKLEELQALYQISAEKNTTLLVANQKTIENRATSALIHKDAVKLRMEAITDKHTQRNSVFIDRQIIQKVKLNLPLFPTTTIGSFPQTDEIRMIRAKYKKGELSHEAYDLLIEKHTQSVIEWQEEIGLDVLVHGEYERNDMVEYFGELLSGYTFTQYGWVQSYGSRCVKPPVIYGDIERKSPMTVKWSSYAQSLTEKPMKGMLTGPITILQWSFVRDDQARSETMMQIALAIRDEVSDLENAGIQIIQIDEAAIREGLPLRRNDWDAYLEKAIKAFKVASTGVKDTTQIHTHMCYSEFNEIIESIAAMDADVITIETSRSQMELLDVFAQFNYPNEIGPGVYDIHSPRVPSVEEMVGLLSKAQAVLPAQNLWVNPDCGLKTRKWPETELALKNMVLAARKVREQIAELV